MKLGILGMGVVGNALYDYYRNSHEVWTYDKAKDTESDILALNRNAEVVFVCVPTPYAGGGRGLDCSEVFNAVGFLCGSNTVIIKSTVNPGVTDAVQEQFPQHRVFFVPEFLSEVTAAKDYAHARRPHVVGCSPDYPDLEPDEYDEVMSWESLLPYYAPEYVKDGCIRRNVFLPAKQAELLKLASNAFYALKVSFANQLYDAGATQETLDALADDPWIQPSHFSVEHKGYRGFGGMCLVKDTLALADYLRDHHNPLACYTLPDAATLYNTALLQEQDVDPERFLGKKPNG